MSFWTDWSDGKKWMMGIVSAVIVGALVAGVNYTIRSDNAATRSLRPPHDQPQTIHLPEEQTRAQIGVALGKGEIDQAIALLRTLPIGEAKDEECDRVFSFCIKNPRLDKALDSAAVVASDCWTDERRQAALQEIAITRLKE